MINCETCGYENPDDTEFCVACGAELTLTTPPPTVVQPYEMEMEKKESFGAEDSIPQTVGYFYEMEKDPFAPKEDFTSSTQPTFPNPIPTPTPQPATFGAAKLITKTPNAPIPEFTLDGTNLIIGRFDPDTGPVDVDLESFPGEDTISRNHAEIYQEGGQWKIKDLGSTNGVFLKRAGQSRFGARITIPESIYSGDEVAIAKIRFLFQTA